MLSKSSVLVVSGILVTTLIIFDFLGTATLCGGRQYTSCMQNAHSWLVLFLPVFPTFLFSLLTYKLPQNVYESWFKFARWAIPLSMFLIFLAPEYSNDWMFPIEKGTVALFSSAAFALVSTIIISLKYFARR